MKKIFKKTRIFLNWIFGLSLELGYPVENFEYKKEKNSLIGDWYKKELFLNEKNEKIIIKSPIYGKLNRILNDSFSLISTLGIEVLLIIDKEKNENLKINFFKKEGESVKKNEKFLEIKDNSDEKNGNKKIKLFIIIPWQPLKIKKVEERKIFYKNPFSKQTIKRVYEY